MKNFIKILIFTVISGILFSAVLDTTKISNAKRRALHDYHRFIVIRGDSLLSVSPESLQVYLNAEGYASNTAIAESIAALEHRALADLDSGITSTKLWTQLLLKDSVTFLQIALADSTGALTDSLKIVLSNAKAYTNAREIAITSAYKTTIGDSLAQNKIRTAKQITDSLGQPLVVIPNDLKINGNELFYGNGASVTNPSSGLLALNSTVLSCTGDSTYIRLARIDSIKQANGFMITNAIANRATLKEDTIAVDGFLRCYKNLYTDDNKTNSFFGVDIAPVISSGVDNTVAGNEAGNDITTGSYNSIFGYQAGTKLTTGNFNNLYGTWAGKLITKGTYNNIVGNEAGYYITTGEHNTIMGHNAMLGTAGDTGTAGWNTMIGANSGYKINNGSYNVGLGFRAFGAGNGSYNTMIGTYAGYGSTTGNTGDRNVFIGYMAGSSCSTSSDILEIGSSVAGGATQTILKGNFADSTLTATGNLTLGKTLILPNSAVISNTHADSLYFTESFLKFNGSLVTYKPIYLPLANASISQTALNTIFAGDTLTVRSQLHVNPYSATSPETSIFIGKGAGKVGATGANNVLMGFQSGKSITSGQSDILIGAEAGSAISAGSFNSYLGSYAGRLLTGAHNTGIGYATLAGSGVGTSNAAIGSGAGMANTSGSFNTFAGYRSGYANTTGSRSVFIADSAGYTNTTGSGNVFIGNKAINANATDAYKLVIQSDNGNTAQKLITGDFATGDVTITNKLISKHRYDKFSRVSQYLIASINKWWSIPYPARYDSLLQTNDVTRTIAQGDTLFISNVTGVIHVNAVSHPTYTGTGTGIIRQRILVKPVGGTTSAGWRIPKCARAVLGKATNASGDKDDLGHPSEFSVTTGDSIFIQVKTDNTNWSLLGADEYGDGIAVSANVVFKYLGK